MISICVLIKIDDDDDDDDDDDESEALKIEPGAHLNPPAKRKPSNAKT